MARSKSIIWQSRGRHNWPVLSSSQCWKTKVKLYKNFSSESRRDSDVNCEVVAWVNVKISVDHRVGPPSFTSVNTTDLPWSAFKCAFYWTYYSRFLVLCFFLCAKHVAQSRNTSLLNHSFLEDSVTPVPGLHIMYTTWVLGWRTFCASSHVRTCHIRRNLYKCRDTVHLTCIITPPEIPKERNSLIICAKFNSGASKRR